MVTKMKGIYKGFKFISQIFGEALSFSSSIHSRNVCIYLSMLPGVTSVFCFKGFGCFGTEMGKGTVVVVVVKEREMEIGYPTDVKHVAHIGWDGPSGSAPSWMNEFKTDSDFTATSIGNSRDSNPTWSSQDFEQSTGCQPATEMMRNLSGTDLPNIPKKQKRKKKATCSPK